MKTKSVCSLDSSKSSTGSTPAHWGDELEFGSPSDPAPACLPSWIRSEIEVYSLLPLHRLLEQAQSVAHELRGDPNHSFPGWTSWHQVWPMNPDARAEGHAPVCGLRWTVLTSDSSEARAWLHEACSRLAKLDGIQRVVRMQTQPTVQRYR